ncbi:TIGR03756 family integrating conjugative element protein, partial [Escherichia coli]|nr:TIGR03756 family integrating conjugative element protein [Escherichia coli]
MTGLRTRRYAGAFLVWAATVSVADASLNTAQIVTGAVSQRCITWLVSGICYWLHCSCSGCRVRTS